MDRTGAEELDYKKWHEWWSWAKQHGPHNAGVKVKFCVYSFIILFGIGSSTAWEDTWERRRGNLLDGNLTFERQLHFMPNINTLHVRLFQWQAREWMEGDFKGKVLKSSTWLPKAYSWISSRMCLRVMFLQPDLKREIFWVAQAGFCLSSISASGWYDTILPWQLRSALVWIWY